MSDYDFDDLLGELDKNAKVEKKVEKKVETPVVPTKPSISTQTEEADYSSEFTEVIASSKTYLNRYFEINDEMAVLKEELKDIKATAKEEGVPVGAINQAVKELERELKETTEDAKNTIDAKKLIKSDDKLYGNIVAKVS